jgi:hypothetical protein
MIRTQIEVNPEKLRRKLQKIREPEAVADLNSRLENLANQAVEAAKEKTPVKTGDIRDAWEYKVIRGPNGKIYRIIVQNSYSDPRIPIWLQYGTKRHFIPLFPKTDESKPPWLYFWWEKMQTQFRGRSVDHPGIKTPYKMLEAAKKVLSISRIIVSKWYNDIMNSNG